ncbi:MAG: TonB-dependent receptor, partial [Tardiphaga sp.]|nr:TonB-dependent receptor [Tardiphaga sp.]
QQLYDVQRVEVLKGPQGTLFGRNATGGLIHIITAKPSDRFGGFVQGAYGNYNEYRLEGGVSIPLGTGVSSRISFLRDKRKGFFANSIGPRLNEDDTVAGRAQLRFKPNADLDILISADNYKILPLHTGAAYATAGAPDANGLGQPLPPGTPTGFGYVDADGNPFTGAFDDPGLLKRTQKNVSGRIQYDFGGVTLTSLTSYSTLFTDYREDNDLSPFPITVFYQRADAKYFTQELRVGSSRGAFRWTAGAYYLSIDGTYRQAFDVKVLGTLLDANYAQKTSSYSLFAQGEYDLAKQLTLILGGRYTRDRKRYNYLETCTGPACGFFILPGTIGAAGGYRDRHSEGGVSARAQINYKPTDDLLLYLSYNRGYKAFNYNAGFAGQAPLRLARFDGEKLNAYEFGIKSEFADRRIRFNAATFYYDYKNYQAFDQRGLNFTLFNTNATVYGADAELTLSPGAGFNFVAGLSLLHTKVGGVPLNSGPVSREAPQSPHYTANFAASKSFELGFGKLRLNANATRTGRFYSQLTNAPVTRIPANWLVNGRVTLTDRAERVELSGYAKNLLNAKRRVYAFDITSPPFGLVENDYGSPRQYGVELRYNF